MTTPYGQRARQHGSDLGSAETWSLESRTFAPSQELMDLAQMWPPASLGEPGAHLEAELEAAQLPRFAIEVCLSRQLPVHTMSTSRALGSCHKFEVQDQLPWRCSTMARCGDVVVSLRAASHPAFTSAADPRPCPYISPRASEESVAFLMKTSMCCPQVDGRHHFASNRATPLGRTILRDRLLTARGWHVVRRRLLVRLRVQFWHLQQRRAALAD